MSSAQGHPVEAPPTDAQTAAELDSIRASMPQRDGSPLDATKVAQVQFWASGSPAYRWMQLANRELTRHHVSGPQATRALALISAAVYDATIATWANKFTYMRSRPSEADTSIQPLLSIGRSPSYPSARAAAAGAASTVLAYLFPDTAGDYSNLAEEAGRSRVIAGVSYPSDVKSGLVLGQSVGNDVVAYGRTDRSDTGDTRTFPAEPGKWGSANPSAPSAGVWKPWVLESAGQLRLPAPIPSDAAAVGEVRDFPRTIATNRIAYVWQPSFTTPWFEVLEKHLAESGMNDDAPRATRAYALLSIAQHDATLACWDTKYAYLAPRPSQVDPNVTTLFPNPAHPSFPSGHACASGAMAGVLEYLFPDQSRVFTEQSFAEMAREGGLSTFYSAIHFKRDVEAGLSLGRSVADKVVARAAQDRADKRGGF